MKYSILIIFLSLFLGNVASAQHNVKIYDLLNELKFATQDTSKGDIYLKLAQEYSSFDVTKSISKAELSLMIANSRKDVRRTFDALAVLVETHSTIPNDLPKAVQYFSKIQNLDSTKFLLEQKAHYFGLEGRVYYVLLDYEKSKNAYLKQLSIYEKLKNEQNIDKIANTNFALGELFFAQADGERAISYYQKAIQLFQQSNNINKRIEALNAIGKAYLKIGNNSASLQYCNDALFLSESLSDKKLVAHINLNTAQALYANAQYDDANDKLTIAQSIAEDAGNQHLLTNIKLLQGKILQTKNLPLKAAALFHEALDISWLANDKVLTKDIYEALYEYYEHIDDVRNAHFYLKGLTNMRDSLKAEENNKQLTISKIRFETEEKDKENRRLRAVQLENQVTIQRQKFSNYILIVLLLAGLGAGYFLYQNLKQRKAYNNILKGEVQKRTEELEQSNDELTQTNRRLEQSNDELERFAYIASHDLKSPLRNVISFLNLIERKIKKQDDDDLKSYIRFATENAKQMNVLIQDVLEFSRIDTDSQSNRLERIDINDSLMLAIQNLHEAMKEQNAEIIIGKMPTITASSVHVLQLFQNFISNGLKYNRSDKPEILITHTDTPEQHIFAIKDNGIGIDPKYHDQIFEMFKRLHTREEFKGTGIGLAICKKIVHNMDGRVWVDSEVGTGTTFYFSIPKANHISIA